MSDKLLQIQAELKVPKGNYNEFGKYRYRSCEDILEAVKPICIKYGCILTLTDKIVAVSDRVYVEATASLRIPGENGVYVTAYAREPETKKGMDESQITGAASSYARKYALNGLFAIDDTKDADTMKAEDKQPEKKIGNTAKVIGAYNNVKTEEEKAKIISLAKELAWTNEQYAELLSNGIEL